MTVYTCGESFEEMMTCIYEAWAGRRGHANIKLQLEPVDQPELFCEYLSVCADAEKAEKVVRAIRQKISAEAYRQVFYAAMSVFPDRLEAIYRFLILGFACGAKVTHMLSEPSVMRVLELSRKCSNEMHYFREFTRFTAIDTAPGGQVFGTGEEFSSEKVYVAHIEPKCNITALTAGHFADRMPSEHWMIIDDNRRIAAVHPKNQPFYMTALSGAEMQRLAETEQRGDCFTELWQEFFRTIGIRERRNEKCQKNLMPLWYRKHMTECRQ
ncbi:putative DNA metabolism protein [Marvinbryantia formatexigens DSM 14469]|uniref:DNA metabolism protein n=1 Tax=Marvinbryantia formatexigens DSM 14469 TaxID=478749 RepID=C6LH27_9FIRM|nr:TIGR03915 family putative DNA repair protein [Marvinbryantia formatexigens]EET60086.1 putative DNA metabolism protein [Marvinbryantia formatexigens DSM 14469]UWO23875.1 TIGR03915 family putative DNA repair protein [Marvinbryantia formatexigens DSM 14469]SDG51438.1 probable DNA metabolism protein [Marvinbryantia formatexigens]